jgi:hypothetical protein
MDSSAKRLDTKPVTRLRDEGLSRFVAEVFFEPPALPLDWQRRAEGDSREGGLSQ